MREFLLKIFIQDAILTGLFLVLTSGFLCGLTWFLFKFTLPKNYKKDLKRLYEQKYNSPYELKIHFDPEEWIVGTVFRDTDLRRFLKPSWASELNDSVKFSNLCLWLMRLTYLFIFLILIGFAMMFIPGLFGAQ